MIFNVDIDGVLRNFVDSLRWTYNLAHPSQQSLPVVTWDMLASFPAFKTNEELKRFYSVDRATPIYAFAKPYVGAIETLMKLQGEGHIVRLVTTQPTLEAIRATMLWIGSRVDPLITTIFTQEKHTIPCDIHVDDSFDILKKIAETGNATVGPVCVSQPWNTEWTGPRISQFSELPTLLEKLGL